MLTIFHEQVHCLRNDFFAVFFGALFRSHSNNFPTLNPENHMLPDLQNNKDQRGIDIDQVGVSNVRYPLTLPLRQGEEFGTVANLSMTVSLPHYLKGTHMSRFMTAINEQNHHFRPDTVHLVLEELLRLLDSCQLTANKQVATPANWQQGDDVIIAPAVQDEEAKEKYPGGWESPLPYIRIVPQPE